MHCTAHIAPTMLNRGKDIQQIKVEPATDSGSMEKVITENGLQKQREKNRFTKLNEDGASIEHTGIINRRYLRIYMRLICTEKCLKTLNDSVQFDLSFLRTRTD